ncbi:MAG: bifunctional serine/threonine-protein kinase/formylglycine-generating enzyme family protein [Planctomycetota bacterium]
MYKADDIDLRIMQSGLEPAVLEVLSSLDDVGAGERADRIAELEEACGVSLGEDKESWTLWLSGLKEQGTTGFGHLAHKKRATLPAGALVLAEIIIESMSAGGHEQVEGSGPASRTGLDVTTGAESPEGDGKAADLSFDPLLVAAPLRRGYKVLGGVVLYQKLGQGGMGAVYRGKHLRLEVDVALKVMVPPASASPQDSQNCVQRFLREAKTAAAVKNQNLIRVYDVNSESGIHYLIMDYVDGESARGRLKRKGGLSEQEAVEICLGAADGLAAAHEKGIVHRDVKPDNILIDKKGQVVIADLGLAKGFGAGPDSGLSMGLSITSNVMGTLYYMSPEQTRSAKDVGPQADVWSLGVTLYHLACGKLPWSHTDLADLILKIRSDPPPDIRSVFGGASPGLCSILDKALRKNPSERYADCVGMAKALRDHLRTIRTGDEGILADSDAGMTMHATKSMPTPPTGVLSYVLNASEPTVDRPADSGAMAAAPAPSSSPMPAEARPRPGWVIPGVVGGAGVLLLVLVALLFAAFPPTGNEPDPIETRAEAFYNLQLKAFAAGDYQGVIDRIDSEGTRFGMTTFALRVATLREKSATSLAEKLALEEDRRKNLALEAERRKRQALEATLAEGKACEDRDAWREAREHYEAALGLADEARKNYVEQLLAQVEQRIRVEKVLEEIEHEAEAGSWRKAWDLVEKARGAGIEDPAIPLLRLQIAKALAPPARMTGPLGVEFVLIRGGTFRMGSDSGSVTERPAHTVAISPFYIGRYEVTNAQYDERGPRIPSGPPPGESTAKLPATSISWEDAVSFCEYLSKTDPAEATYRLPREAEWEFAARGTEERTYPWGNTAPTREHANLSGEADGFASLAPVGSFEGGATPEGVIDMAGNAYEWCLDWYGQYPEAAQTDPVGAEKGKLKVIRGGAFAFDASRARGSARGGRRHDHPADFIGVRAVRELTREERQFLELAGGVGGPAD